MRILEFFVASPLAGAIGWTLLHSLWEGAAVSAILATILIGVRSPRLRYAAASSAMLAIVAAFAITLFRMVPHATQAFPQFRTPLHLAPVFAPQQSKASHSWLPSLSGLAPWLAPLWIIGAFLFALQRVTSCLAIRRLRRTGVCFASKEWHAQLARLATQLRVSLPVHILESCFAEVPMVLGHLRPVILMPLGLLANLPADQVETILLHELAHIRRCDYLVNVFQRFVEGLLFYHPAIWWISKIMRAERENCCDDVVVSVTHHRHEYALALAAVERNRLPRHEAAVAATGGTLVKRIRRLLYPKAPASFWAPALAVAILAVSAGVSLAAAKAKSNQGAPAPSQTAVEDQTFTLVSPMTPQDLDRIVTGLRGILDSGQVQAIYTDNAIVVTDTPDKINLAGKIIAAEDLPLGLPALSNDSSRLQLLLQVQTLHNLIEQNRVTEAQPLRNAIIQENQSLGPAAQSGATETDPYSKWLNEDVVYIITPEERDTFLRLKTNDERDQFINAFWDRRNPAPGSADNAFKDEIYRRIDYADQHFAASSTPGWKTDRGRIYITWGQPDEVESHKAGETWNRPMDLGGGTATTYAYEDWRYNTLAGFNGERQQNVIFEFVDPTGTGEFRLAKGPNEKDAEPLPNGRSQETAPSTPDNEQANLQRLTELNNQLDEVSQALERDEQDESLVDSILQHQLAVSQSTGTGQNTTTPATSASRRQIQNYERRIQADMRKQDDLKNRIKLYEGRVQQPSTKPTSFTVDGVTDLDANAWPPQSGSAAAADAPKDAQANQNNDGKIVRTFVLPDQITQEQIAEIVSEMLKGLGGRAEIITGQHEIAVHGTPDDVWLAGKLMLEADDKLGASAPPEKQNSPLASPN